MSKDPVIVDAILNVVRGIGLHQLTVQQVMCKLRGSDLFRIPAKTTVTKIIHDRFGLSYRAFNSAKLRMNQQKFNDKRLWICRLLAQTLSEDYLVVSIDESSFSTDIE